MALQRDVKAGYSLIFVFIASIFSIHHLISREESFTLGIVYTIAFAAYTWISYVDKPDWKLILGVGLIARIILFWDIPSLSDDFYRFLWDGSLVNTGTSPYLYTPNELPSEITFPNQALLLSHLNSPAYFSVYTPLHQLIFATSTFIFQDVLSQINVIRVFFIAGDLISLFILKSLVTPRQMSMISVLFLNPLLILEGVGNLHIEVMTIPLIILCLTLLIRQKTILASIPLSLAIGLKLTPALLLPAIAWRYRWKKGTYLSAFAFGLIAIFLLPVFLADGVTHIKESLALYQRTFEFNASLYYLLREVGFWYKGYNIIATLGPALSRISAAFILLLVLWGSWKKLPTTDLMLFSWTIYILLSTTIHPWYILPLLPLAVITGYYYPVVWTFTVFFSYFGYTSEGYVTPFGWISIEYAIVYGILIYEIIKRNTSNRNGAAPSLTV
jgi:alpha-1,6-mannosyltransferase